MFTFAIPAHSYPHVSGEPVLLPSYADLYTDFHAQQRHRQRQLALKQAEAAELRRRVQEEREAAAYRAALAAELERRHRQAAFAREQRRREEDRRRLFEARRARQRQVHVPAQLLELLFHLEPTEHQDDYVDDTDNASASSDDGDDTEDVVHLVPLGFPIDDTQPSSADESLSSADADSDTASDFDDAASDLDDTVIDLGDAATDSTFTICTDDSSSTLRTSALSALAGLSAEFASRRAAFVSPSTLTFSPSPSPSPSPASRASRSPTPPLAFGAANAPFLGYEEALLALLTRIDAVESHGDADVKRARKDLVRAVEGELERLDALREKAWEEQSGASAEEDASEADDESMSSEDDEEEEEAFAKAQDEVDVLTLSSDTDSSASDSDLDTAAPVKIPFTRAASSSRRMRDASPSSSSASSDDDDNDDDDTPMNAGSDQVASLLLGAHKLGDRLDEISEDEREQTEIAALRDASGADRASEEEELSSDEEGVWVYC
ncbi:hypothetical protein JCM3770_003074 [Rhodotorula araucariae]